MTRLTDLAPSPWTVFPLPDGAGFGIRYGDGGTMNAVLTEAHATFIADARNRAANVT